MTAVEPQAAGVPDPVEVVRHRSHPVRRTVRGGEPWTLGGVDMLAELRYIGGERMVVHAVFPLPNGGTAVVEPVDASGEQWRASAGAGWLPGTFEGIYDAVHAALRSAASDPKEN